MSEESPGEMPREAVAPPEELAGERMKKSKMETTVEPGSRRPESVAETREVVPDPSTGKKMIRHTWRPRKPSRSPANS